ncbi:MAG: hypothetical protein KAS23_07130, partial [Anaerohalosphaera sp.]|nr:hypothetical protein [Anaerohalosphaera sp.]
MLKRITRLCFISILFFLPSMAFGVKLSCTVTIVDIHAAPVSDAEVAAYESEYDRLTRTEKPRMLCDTQKTNADGKVVLELDYKSARRVMIVAHKVGYAIGWDMLPYNDIAAANINIVLDKPVKFVGRLVDVKGQPVVNASVEAQPKISKMRRLEQRPVIGPAEWMTTSTGKDGRFQWSCFGADVRSDFLVTLAGEKTTYKFTPHRTSSCGFEAGREDICLTAPKSVAVQGKVVDEEGKGVADMVVVIKPDHQDKKS